jgi:hypothetical protein
MNFSMTFRCFWSLAVILALSLFARAQGTIQVSSVTVSPNDPFHDRQPGCAWATVHVTVNKQNVSEDPTLLLSVYKYRSSPAEIAVEVSPPWVQATIPGTAAFDFRVCTSGQRPGKFSIEAAIAVNGVAPRNKFVILKPDPPEAAQAEITIPGTP